MEAIQDHPTGQILLLPVGELVASTNGIYQFQVPHASFSITLEENTNEFT